MARDIYANMASNSVAANGVTLTFNELLTGISLGQGMGLIIDEIDYYIDSTLRESMDADTDYIFGAWTTSNAITDIEIDNRSVIHKMSTQILFEGTPANAMVQNNPVVFQFLPPIIVAAPRIYLAVDGKAGLTGALRSRIYFRYIKLSPQEYLELAEAFILVG